MFIHRRCARLLECLPSLQHDPNRPEDVLKVDANEDGIGGDDAADTLRYLVATKTRAVTQRKLRGL
jgi:phage terminase large subunit